MSLDSTFPPSGDPNAPSAAGSGKGGPDLDVLFPDWLSRPGVRPVRDAVLAALGVRRVLREAERARLRWPGERLLPAVLRGFGMTWNVIAGDVSMIPAEGPVIVVANHPFGGAEGMVLHEAVRGRRDDVRTMAARQLAMYEELRRDFILVDPTARTTSARDNVRPMLETLRWLGAGGAVAMFPAGAISQYSRRARMVIDPPWHPMLGALVRRSGATVVPVLFHGANSLLFRVIGAINRKLSTALLARELLNMRGAALRLSIAEPAAAAELLRSGSDEAVTLEIRRRAYALAEAGSG